MKIEIDLNEILGDESGVETLQESVRRQVIEKLSRQIQDGIGNRIDNKISEIINVTIKKSMEELTPSLIGDLMNAEYTPVDRWGSRKDGGPTTFRKELVRSINEEMIYKKASYESDKNTFTKAVDSVVLENVNKLKIGFDKLVNEMFTQACFDYAKNALQKKLGVK